MNMEMIQTKRTGVILAKVTNITDPDNLNRVKCKPVTSDPDVLETDWCYCISPFAGNAYGQFFFPSVDEYVLLGYLGGDVHHPIIFGSYWANTVKPPYPIKDGLNEVRSIKTPKGIEIKMEDTPEKEKLTLTTPSGAKLFVNDEAKTIDISDPKGENKLTFAWENGEITLSAKTKITLSAGTTTLELDSKAGITAKADKDISLTAANIKHKGNTGVSIEGAKVDVKANTMLTAQSSGVTTIKGTPVKIN